MDEKLKWIEGVMDYKIMKAFAIPILQSNSG